MKTRFYLVMAMIALSWMGCSQEEDAVNQMQMNGGKTINATIESITRSTVTDAGVFSWTDGDAISLHSDEKSDFYTYNSSLSKFYLNTTPSNVDFPQVAYYPGNASHTESKFYLRETYGDDYSPYVENTYAAMIATPPTEGNTFEFKHLGGVMRFNVKNVPEGTTEFVFTAVGKRISGLFTVNETEGTIATEDTENEDEQNSVSIKFAELQEPADMTFYVPMPVGTYGDYIVGFKINSEFKSYKSTEVTNTIARKTLLLMPTFTFDGTTLVKGSAKVGVIDLEDGNKSADISASADIVVTPGDANATATLNYTPENNGTSVLSLSDGSGATESGNSEGKVVVETAAGSTVASCEINTPSLTVELTAPESGAVTFNEVTALTAQQTLVIGEGVTIKKLVLKGGNVILKGNVESIESEVPTTITLDKDITLNNSMTFTKGNVTVDLNGKSIKCASSDVFVVTAGTLTINDKDDNSGLVYGSEDNSSSSCAVWAKENGTVIINGGTYKVGHDGASKTASKNNWRNDCIYARDNAKITINGGEFAYTGDINTENFQSDGNRFLLNCRDQDYKAGTCSITVKGGTFHKFNPGATSSENPVASYVAAGYSSVASGNDTYVVEEGILNEAALKAAIAAGKTEVTLGENIDLTSSVVVSSDLSVNLNGKSIKCASSDVFVVTDGTLTINGEGLVYGSEDNKGNSCAVWVNGANAKAIINNGTYKVGGDIYGTSDKRNDCIYVGKDGGTIEIYDGVFEYTGDVKDGSLDDGSRFLINQNNAHNGQLITVYGGTFHNFDPANAKTDEPWMTDGIGSFVAPGYSSVANGDYFEVKGGIYNETALKAAIVNGAEITLNADMTIEKAITIPTGITATINLNGFDVTAPNTDVFEVAGTLTIKDTKNNEGVVSAGTGHPNASVCAVWANGGNVTIEGGHYKAYSDAAGKRNDCIYAGYNADNNNTAGMITINGGKFEYIWPTEKNSGIDYNGDMYLLNCADKDLYETLITVNGGQFKNNAPSYEPTTPAGRTGSEVQLGTNKKVYNGETEVTDAHSGTTDIWYVVK